MPAMDPIIPTMVLIRSFENLELSSALFSAANILKISFSALKLLITENPPRQSVSTAVKFLFRSDTFFSAPTILLPVIIEAISGRIVTPTAIAVSSGEYQIISVIEPKNITDMVKSESS